jgi:hypothetical protein
MCLTNAVHVPTLNYTMLRDTLLIATINDDIDLYVGYFESFLKQSVADKLFVQSLINVDHIIPYDCVNIVLIRNDRYMERKLDKNRICWTR